MPKSVTELSTNEKIILSYGVITYSKIYGSVKYLASLVDSSGILRATGTSSLGAVNHKINSIDVLLMDLRSTMFKMIQMIVSDINYGVTSMTWKRVVISHDRYRT